MLLEQLGNKVFGSKHDRTIKKIQPIVDEINRLEPSIRILSDQALQNKTKEFREFLSKESDPEKQINLLDHILPEAFAVVREAGRRTIGMRHFDVQLIGGIVLHKGSIAEMRTGEGKTLVATLPVYLNALLQRGVHVVTVNDYLARRDAEWMGEIYRFLGLSVGVVVHDMFDHERKEAYRCDVTYGQNNEFGFDYLRDNMKYRLEDYVQRDLFYAIVDEVDSILIDEARTPLIISGPTDDSTDKYYRINQIIPSLKKEEDFTLDEKSKTVNLTEEGMSKVEKALNVSNLYDPNEIETLHHVNQALRAHSLYHLDTDYVVRDDEVIIVDEFTGRLMPGRRWSDGLHQAIEAKEGVTVQNENQTLASITFQNYFRMFRKLAGMTGTADTEAEEFQKIYNLGVVVIPTNKPNARLDHPDVIYRSEREKFEAITKDVKELHEKEQPVLVGTVSIDKSERLSKYLKRNGIPHNVLNAKHHEREAEIIKGAGQPGAVTIATNMAGRGTDIVLGEGVPEKGGLFIIGTERHESRRIDNQLRGRSGRQGDPGASRFYLSLEDDLMRIFANDRVQKILEWAGMEEGEAIEHKMTTRAIEGAQRRVEGHNFDIRKHLLKYDDVMNKQRRVIYDLRREVLSQSDIKDMILEDVDEVLSNMAEYFAASSNSSEEWDWNAIHENLMKVFDVDREVQGDRLAIKSEDELREKLKELVVARYEEKEKQFTPELMRKVEREIKLRTIDTLWKDHLLNMDHLKEAVGFEGYAQKDPLVEYQKRGFGMFAEMIYGTKEATLERLFHVYINPEEMAEREEIFRRRREQQMNLVRGQMPQGAMSPGARSQETAQAPIPGQAPQASAQGGQTGTVRKGERVGRNDPCPCGSGRKYKKCHGS